jgi:hypothetical protein
MALRAAAFDCKKTWETKRLGKQKDLGNKKTWETKRLRKQAIRHWLALQLL